MAAKKKAKKAPPKKATKRTKAKKTPMEETHEDMHGKKKGQMMMGGKMMSMRGMF